MLGCHYSYHLVVTFSILSNAINRFYDMAKHAVESTAQSENKITLGVIKEQMGPLIYDITSMKFEV